jgi:hypothetical protein
MTLIMELMLPVLLTWITVEALWWVVKRWW